MIYINKGDDTNFNNNQFLKFNITSSGDMDGWHAEFVLGSLVYTFKDLSKENEIILSSKDSAKLPLGIIHGILNIYDKENRKKTLTNTIPFSVSNSAVQNKTETINLKVADDENISINLDISNTYLKINDLKAGENITIEENGTERIINANVPDVSNFANKNELTNLANINLSNLSNEAKELMSHLAMPSEIWIPLTLGESGQIYIMPEDGYLAIGITAMNSTEYLMITDKNQMYGTSFQLYQIAVCKWHIVSAYFPVYKGQELKIDYTLTGNLSRFNFIYNQGNKHLRN